jgi:anti-sigma factor RsiW
MTCRELVGFLSAYLDGELTADIRARFATHLAGCAACSAYLESYRATVRLAKDAFRDPDAPVPSDVPDDLVQAILAARRKG